MIIQQGLRKDAVHKKYVIGAHPIIQFFMDRLQINGIIGSYVKQDKRLKLGTEKTLSVLIHNILTTPLPLKSVDKLTGPIVVPWIDGKTVEIVWTA